MLRQDRIWNHILKYKYERQGKKKEDTNEN